MVEQSSIVFALSITFYNYSRTSILIFYKLDNTWSRFMSTYFKKKKKKKVHEYCPPHKVPGAV